MWVVSRMKHMCVCIYMTPAVDACVPYYGSEIWTRELGFNQTAAWRPWVAGTADKPLSRQQAGMSVTFAMEKQTANNEKNIADGNLGER